MRTAVAAYRYPWLQLKVGCRGKYHDALIWALGNSRAYLGMPFAPTPVRPRVTRTDRAELTMETLSTRASAARGIDALLA